MKNSTMKIEKRKLKEYVQTVLTDFANLVHDPYSHTVELYDAIPKYVWGNQNRIQGQFQSPIIRSFQHRGQNYQATISPAAVECDGSFKYSFPAQREELIEDALRKLASDGKGVYLEDKSGCDLYPIASVVFTLYELQSELKRMGHTYSIDQIKEGLNICAGTGINLQGDNGSGEIRSNLFETLGLESKEDVGNGKRTRCFVRFNLLVTQSIRKKTYRLLNYVDCMSYKRALSRWMHKRLSHNFKQAGFGQPYKIKLSTIIRDSGMSSTVRISSALQRVEKAFEEMQEKGIISSFQYEKILAKSKSGQSRLDDALFTIFPSSKFIQDAIQANSLMKNSLKNNENLID